MLPSMEEAARQLVDLNERVERLERVELPRGWSLLYDVEIGAPVAAIDITNIPQTYKHLRISAAFRTSGLVTDENIYMRYNGDAGANYRSLLYAIFHPATLLTAEFLAFIVQYAMISCGATAPANWVSPNDVIILDYATTNGYKTFFTNCASFDAAAASSIYFRNRTGLWQSTAAINRITLTIAGGSNFVAGSRLSLHGLK